MPRKKKWVKRKKKKKYDPFALKTTVQRCLVVSDRQIVKFRYVERFEIDPAAGSAATSTYRANDVYDPTDSFGGHSVLGFNEWMAFYNHFTVLGAKIQVNFVASGTNVLTGSAYVGVHLSGNGTPSTNIDTIIEEPFSKYKLLTNAAAGGKATVIQKASIKKFLGQSNLIDEDNNAGTGSSSPLELVYFHVFASGIDATSNPGAIPCMTSIEYIVMLHERKQLIRSNPP